MKEFVLATFLLVAVITFCDADHYIVKNEDELAGRCTSDCRGISGITKKFGCDQIVNCVYSSMGQVWGLVRCNLCRCICVQYGTEAVQPTGPDENYVVTPLYVDEIELFDDDQCQSSDCAGPDPIRTDFKHCKIVRNCKGESTGGHLQFSTFNYCAKCKCDCLNSKVTTKYRLENLKFGENTDIGLSPDHTALTSAIAVNKDPTKTRKITTEQKFKLIKTTTWSNADTDTFGVGVEITAGISILETTVSVNYEKSLTTEFGKANTTEIEQTISGEADIGPMQQVEVKIMGQRYRASLPYTGTLVTTFADGTTSRKPTSGVLKEVGTARFRMVFEEEKPISG